MKRMMILTVSILLFCATESNANVKAKQRPNVLFIAIDDLNDWTDTLKGNPQAKTPHMDRLASKGWFSPMSIARRPPAVLHGLPS